MRWQNILEKLPPKVRFVVFMKITLNYRYPKSKPRKTMHARVRELGFLFLFEKSLLGLKMNWSVYYEASFTMTHTQTKRKRTKKNSENSPEGSLCSVLLCSRKIIAVRYALVSSNTIPSELRLFPSSYLYFKLHWKLEKLLETFDFIYSYLLIWLFHSIDLNHNAYKGIPRNWQRRVSPFCVPKSLYI